MDVMDVQMFIIILACTFFYSLLVYFVDDISLEVSVSINHLSILAVTMVFHHPSVNQLVSIGLGVPAGLYVTKPSFLHLAMCSFSEATPHDIQWALVDAQNVTQGYSSMVVLATEVLCFNQLHKASQRF